MPSGCPTNGVHINLIPNVAFDHVIVSFTDLIFYRDN